MVFREALVLLTITISDGESSGPKRKDTVILLQGTICPPKPFLPFVSSRYILDTYRKIASSNTSRLEAHVGFFRLLMKGIFGPYVL